jgi:hypothetical protein
VINHIGYNKEFILPLCHSVALLVLRSFNEGWMRRMVAQRAKEEKKKAGVGELVGGKESESSKPPTPAQESFSRDARNEVAHPRIDASMN